MAKTTIQHNINDHGDSHSGGKHEHRNGNIHHNGLLVNE